MADKSPDDQSDDQSSINKHKTTILSGLIDAGKWIIRPSSNVPFIFKNEDANPFKGVGSITRRIRHAQERARERAYSSVELHEDDVAIVRNRNMKKIRLQRNFIALMATAWIIYALIWGGFDPFPFQWMNRIVFFLVMVFLSSVVWVLDFTVICLRYPERRIGFWGWMGIRLGIK